MADTEPREYIPLLISVPDTAAAMAEWFAEDNEESAIRWMTETVSRLIQSPHGRVIPAEIIAEPVSTGSLEYDTLLATAVAYALDIIGAESPEWTNKPRLDAEWLWDGDGLSSTEWRDYIRKQTPPMFLGRNILCRDRDFRTA
jgi:hypothetical protein